MGFNSLLISFSVLDCLSLAILLTFLDCWIKKLKCFFTFECNLGSIIYKYVKFLYNM